MLETSLTLAITEPAASAVLLLGFGVLCASSVLFSRLFERMGIPIVLLFLIIGMLGGSEGIGGLEFADYGLAARVGTIALILILFDGGMNTSMATFRRVFWPASLLATLGVALTAGILAFSAKLLGLPWGEALLLGAIVSSTDAAAVFSVLRGGNLHLKQRLGRTLEVESCINDPMAVILTLAVTAYLTSGAVPVWWVVGLEVVTQLAIGGIVGVLMGLGGRWIISRQYVHTVGLLPVLTIAVAFISYGLSTVVLGSGFMAVFATALVLGNGPLAYRSGLARVHDALAWMSQVSMFLMMGLLVFPSHLLPIAGIGLLLALILACLARPISVLLCMLPFKYPVREVGYLSWVGLRGSVPIILATFPVLAGVAGADRVFNLVFFIVVLSSIVPGSTVRMLTRWLELGERVLPAPEAVLEINSPGPLDGEIESYAITPVVAVSGASLSEINFPEGASVILLVRGRHVLAAKGGTILTPGDHAYVFFRPHDREFVELLFGAPEHA